MRYWFVAASDRLGARRGFLVPTERRPTEAGVLKRIELVPSSGAPPPPVAETPAPVV